MTKSTSNRQLEVQGLRGISILFVVFYHAHQLFAGGFIGVDVFFVISGYVITKSLLDEFDATGRISGRNFISRRIKRLLPASAVTTLFILICSIFIFSPFGQQNQIARTSLSSTFFSANLYFIFQNSYAALSNNPFRHMWSLGVEEQFYVVWPIFLLFLARYGKRAIFYGISLTTAASLLLSVYQTQTSPIWAFYSLPTRAWELGVGALLLFIPESVWRNRFIPWIGVIGIGIATLNFNENTAFPGINAVLPVVATALLIGSISSWPRLFNDLSNNRLAQWLGAISYPLYLWHWPALVLPSSALGRPLRVRERLFCILLTVVLAHLTSKFIEQPIRHKKIPGKKVYLFFVGTTVTSLIAGLLISATASSMISVKGTDYKFNLTKVMEKPAVYGDGCHVNYGETKSGYCTYGVKTSKKTIVLYGDSHAAQWFPALEKLALEKGYKLVSLTKSACPSVDVPREDQGAFKNVHCEKWRENSIARIKSIHPAAVIISSFQYFTPPNGYPNRADWWNAGQRRLLADLKGSSSHLIYISDTPRPLRDIPNCLASRDTHSCDSSEKTPVKIISGFEKIDPTLWMCSTFCPAIQNGYVVYRDASHISVAAAIALKPQLEKALADKGLFS